MQILIYIPRTWLSTFSSIAQRFAHVSSCQQYTSPTEAFKLLINFRNRQPYCRRRLRPVHLPCHSSFWVQTLQEELVLFFGPTILCGEIALKTGRNCVWRLRGIPYTERNARGDEQIHQHYESRNVTDQVVRHLLRSLWCLDCNTSYAAEAGIRAMQCGRAI